MWRGTGIAALALLAVGCGGGITKQEAARQVDQLIVLYRENRPNFVVRKQEIEQASSCGRATALRQAVDDKVNAAAMSPDKDETTTLVKMELEQAEKVCLSK